MFLSSLLFTLYHTFKFVRDMRQHLQVGGQGGQARSQAREHPPAAAHVAPWGGEGRQGCRPAAV